MMAGKAKGSQGSAQQKFVYFFGAGATEGKKEMKQLLGGKGANLAEMAGLGIPVPPGFTISTEACRLYNENKGKLTPAIDAEIDQHIVRLEKAMNVKFGDAAGPLLVSVRSGAAASMPGMMDTVLNLGLNDKVVAALAKKNERFAWDSYRRFCQMFGDVVMGVEHAKFEEALTAMKERKKAKFDTELKASDLKELVAEYKVIIKKATGKSFPEEPREQLRLAIAAVFDSWDNDRAITYRRLNDIKGLIGTAVNVQAMVFGNMGETSGTGVCFSRNPSTGKNEFYGEYLMNAQGEDVVAGIRTPQPIATLEKQMPTCYKALVAIYKRLEQHFREMQDMEFTIQEGKLYMLQTRTGKRTAAAAVKIAVDMVNEKLITKEEAVLRVQPSQLDQLLHPMLDPAAKKWAKPLAKGLPASPGAAVGKVVFDAADAVAWAEKDEKVILVRTETSPEDLIGMNAAKGILTSRGGMTSHAAVVARGMGKCCVSGCTEAKIDEAKKTLTINGTILKEGNFLTLDGSTGEVFAGKIAVKDAELSGEFATLLSWADSFRRLKVRTNADTGKDAAVAVRFGAEGIGLCRTEHMFFEGERIKAMRQMILASTVEERKKALAKVLPFQRADFISIFTEMGMRPVTIRLLDPPLHEFLPHEEEEQQAMAKELGTTLKAVQEKVASLAEVNPMLGHRGCRLGIAYPEITEMQTRAIIEAALEAKKKGIDVKPEIMVPLVGNLKELQHQKKVIMETAETVMKEKKTKIDYMIGTMIEVPRAALTADEIASEAEFFSFGTNDLTQMTMGLSRDDAGKFLPSYLKAGIYEHDPFAQLDQTGVGQLVRMAAEKGRAVKPKLKLGICGEHGGDPSSIEFCHKVGLDYVSCSPYRVPIARLAAAHAALKERQK